MHMWCIIFRFLLYNLCIVSNQYYMSTGRINNIYMLYACIYSYITCYSCVYTGIIALSLCTFGGPVKQSICVFRTCVGLPLLPAAILPAAPRRRPTTTNLLRPRRPARAGRCRRAKRGPVRTSRCFYRGPWAPARSTGRSCTPSSSAQMRTCLPRTPPCRSSRPYGRNWTNSLRRIRTLTHPGDSRRHYE